MPNQSRAKMSEPQPSSESKMPQEHSQALLAISHFALSLNHQMSLGDRDKALAALAELRLATADLKAILSHD